VTMTAIVSGLADVTVRAAAAALLHSLWQCALIAAVTGVAWWALRASRPNVRYALGCAALTLMVAAWTATAWRTAAQLVPTIAVAHSGAPAVALGPAGPFDRSPAIRTITIAELEQEQASWANRLDSWSVRLVPLWLVGVFGLSVRLVCSWWVVQRLRRAAQTPAAARLAARVQALAADLRVSRPVRVAQSAAVQVPAVAGWLRPVILLPASALTGLSAPQLHAILAHELAHVRRHDYAVNLLQTAAEILLFYHPACWWISRRVRAERELCCDDVAVSVCGDPLLYATALADLESLRTAPTLALAATDGPLLQRVRRLLAPSPAGPRAPGLMAALVPAALLAAVMTGATFTAAAAQAPPQTTASATDRTLPAGHGIVRGQIVDAQSGRPIAGASYEIAGPEDYASGTTDENGRFQTRPIKAGPFTMVARAKGYVLGAYGGRESPFGAPIDVRAGRVSSGIDIRMQAAGAINGRIVDSRGNGLQGVEIVLDPVSDPLSGGRRPEAAFAQTTENGGYRIAAAPGDYYVRAYVGEPLPAAKGVTPPTYVTTFYPGVRVKEEGQPLRIEAGLDLYDIDFALATGNLVRVRGRVIDPSGDSLAGVRIAAIHMGRTARGGSMGSPVAIDAEGHFDIRDLVPGEYMFNVVDQRKTSRWVGAMKHLTLDADVDDLEMRASTGAHVVGRIVRDPSSTGESDLTEVRIRFVKRLPETGFRTSGGTRISADGTFETETPGDLVTIEATPPDGWVVKSVHLDRVDVDGQAVDMSGGTRQLQIVLTDRANSVSGMVVDRNGRTLPAYSVVLFSEDETRWTPSSRFVMAAQSSQTGQFRLKDVPAGEYYAVAVPSLPFRAWTDSDVLIRLQPIATKLKVSDGEQKTISIRASPTPDNLPGR
jgi:beta-lactamase regulating signal transducer with metallopeptidase domain